MKSPSRRILVRLSATHADKIRAAFGKAIDSEQVAQSFGETYFAGETITPQTARDWAKVHILVHKAPLVEALKRTYADGWVTGDTSARYVLSHLVRRTKAIEAPRVGVVNWDTWKPGNQAASELLSPKGGLRSLLDNAYATIEGVSNTKLDRIGTVLAQALAEGVSPKQVSILVDQVVNDPQQALVIAQTEMSRAVVQSELELYAASGVEMLEWLVADPCDDCAENEDASPLPIDESWPNGDVPVHPNCMCDITPYLSTDTTMAVEADLTKFVPSSLEVERALSRLEILPNPADLPEGMDATKYVESPWQSVLPPTVNPNVWDDAELALVRIGDLIGTDTYMRKRKVKEHIKSMGSALTPNRNFALIVERDGIYIILDGRHRLFAMWLLGMQEAPVWLATENKEI